MEKPWEPKPWSRGDVAACRVRRNGDRDGGQVAGLPGVRVLTAPDQVHVRVLFDWSPLTEVRAVELTNGLSAFVAAMRSAGEKLARPPKRSKGSRVMRRPSTRKPKPCKGDAR